MNITGDRYNEISSLCCPFHGCHFMPIHDRFQGLKGINLHNHHSCPETLCSSGNTPSTPAVADNHKCGTCNEVIGRSQNTVDCRLTCAVPVVEKVFCQSIIHSYKGIFECAIPGHGSQPDHTCGGLFCTADHAFRLLRALLMKGCNQVSSIIDGQIGFHVQGGTDLFVIRIIIHTAAGKCWYFIDHIECCSYVILGAEGI
jgi:hypothetical protein